MAKILFKPKNLSALVLIIFLAYLTWMFLPKEDLVREDVYFMGRNLQGLTARQTEELLVARFVEWQQAPLDAVYDQERNVIIPELLGYRVDIGETLERIMKAASGQTVFPSLEAIQPEICIADYPAAFIEQGNPQKNEVALMINVAWGSEYLGSMLDIMSSENIVGTFFVVGRWGRENEELLRAIAAKGHELANHGHTDSVVYTELTAEEMETGLKEVNSFINNITGQSIKYYTPHKGEYNQLLLEVASRMGMRTVLWTTDTVDWKKPGVETMRQKVINNLQGGNIILMHPTEDTVTFLRETIPLIKQKGFELVTIEQLLSPHYPPAVIKFSDLQ